MGVSLQTSEKKQVQTCPNLSRSEQAMRRFCLGLLMALCLASPIKAWGGLFNRFNPSLMSDVYGAGSYGKQLYSAADGGKVNQNLAEIIEEELEAEAKDPCNGGTCLPVYGKKQGEQCYRDTDCESGFLCLESMCQTPMPGVKGLGEDCRTSSDCNISKGLCCKLHRRARSQPKKDLLVLQ